MQSTTFDKPTIYVIDDLAQERESLAAVAATQGWLCQSFASASQFFTLPELSRPGCLILDYRLEHESGLEVLQKLNQQADALPTIVVTAYADVPLATEFMRRGAVTLLQKPYPTDELIANIRIAIDRDTKTLDLQRRMARLQHCKQQLTTRQQQVADLVLQGYPNKKIATLLGISQRTVENKRAEILELYQVSNAIELATKITEYRDYLSAQQNQPGPTYH